MKRLFRIVAVMVTGVCCSFAASTVDLKQMREYFKNTISGGPYIYLQSPRTGLGLGSVYTVAKGQTIFFSRPEECFSQAFLDRTKSTNNTDTMAVDNLNLTGKYSWQLGLKVANAGPITKETDAEFSNKHVTSMTVTIPYLKRQLITVKELKSAIDNDMDLDCRGVLTASNPERWIILESLFTDELSISFQDDSGKDVSVSGGLIRILFPSAKYDSQGSTKGTLKFTGTDHIVAIKAVKIKDINKYAAGEKDFVVVDPDAFYTLMDRR
jgi:hypothetical protein